MSITPGTPCLLLPGIPEAGGGATALRVVGIEELRKALGLPDGPFIHRDTCWHIDRETTWEIRRHGQLTGLVRAPYVSGRYLMPLRDPDADTAETCDRTVTA